MKIKIFAIGMMLVMLSSSYTIAAKLDIECDNIYQKNNDNNSGNILFRDDFDEYTTNWQIITEFTDFNIHHGMAQLTIWQAWRFMYSNVEIRVSQKFQFNHLKMRTQINNSWGRFDELQEPKTGSYGFGFWNFVFNPKEMEYAWFFYSNSPNPFYKKNGLWAVCKSPTSQPHGGCSLIKIEGYNITDWHEYEIYWSENSVDFIIDGKNVAHVTKGVPQESCIMHAWQDNAAWYGSSNGDVYYPKFLRVKHHNMVFIDYIQITE